MFCHNCGKPVRENSKFCTSCGTKLIMNESVQPDTTQAPVCEAVQQEPNRNSSDEHEIQLTPAVEVTSGNPSPVTFDKQVTPVSVQPAQTQTPQTQSVQPVTAQSQVNATSQPTQPTPAQSQVNATSQPTQPAPAQSQVNATSQPTQPAPAQGQVNATSQPNGTPEASEAKKSKKKKTGVVVLVVILILLLLGGGAFAYYYFFWDKDNSDVKETETTESVESVESVETAESVVATVEETVETEVTTEVSAINDYVVNPVFLSDYTRPSILSTYAPTSYEINALPYTIENDLSNVYNNAKVSYWSDEWKQELASEGFFITNGWNLEAFSIYESNRYDYTANFVTVDSLMHTYHLYFSYLLKNTEKNYLINDLTVLTADMLDASSHMYEIFLGTEWEQAAYNNLAFFSVATKLLTPEAEIPDTVSGIVEQELALINAADSSTVSPVFGVYEDYSQYKPRGYYEFDENLIRYFKTMMWYGRTNFTQNDETMNRSALLMTLALHNGAYSNWESIYTVTAFFAGASDDNGFYEYMPIILEAYGENVSVSSLLNNEEAFETFTALTANLDPPMINSVLGGTTANEDNSLNVSFRFMGQRFTIDEAVFQNLCYPYVSDLENPRYLPDVLDLPAALGSEKALDILTAQGETEYMGYSDRMVTVRNVLASAPEETWKSSLYANWIYTLAPLLERKGEGYPMFMQSEKWATKELVTFSASYSELKHDTVLYAKQMIAEMGGGDIDTLDDRGYVEPQVEVYARLINLISSTKDGLNHYGYLSPDMAEDLDILYTLAYNCKVISEKELRNETPTEEEFELIRSYGGQLEHFWQKVNMDEAENGYATTMEFPGAVISDIATGNGLCLEAGTGYFNTIYAVVPVDGQLKLTVGCIYSFYEFAQPASNRLTDTQWREILGIYWNPENPDYGELESISYPAWESEIVHEW